MVDGSNGLRLRQARKENAAPPVPPFLWRAQVTYHIAVDAASIARNLGVAMDLFREMRDRCVRVWLLATISIGF